jgi:hypothetical protein
VQIEREPWHAICEWRERVGYDFRMVEALYAIDEFPDDYLLWRIEWVAGVSYKTNVPSDP